MVDFYYWMKMLVFVLMSLLMVESIIFFFFFVFFVWNEQTSIFAIFYERSMLIGIIDQATRVTCINSVVFLVCLLWKDISLWFVMYLQKCNIHSTSTNQDEQWAIKLVSQWQIIYSWTHCSCCYILCCGADVFEVHRRIHCYVDLYGLLWIEWQWWSKIFEKKTTHV